MIGGRKQWPSWPFICHGPPPHSLSSLPARGHVRRPRRQSLPSASLVLSLHHTNLFYSTATQVLPTAAESTSLLPPPPPAPGAGGRARLRGTPEINYEVPLNWQSY